MKNKTCSTCKEILPISEFSKKHDTRDGYSYRCRKCRSKQWKSSYYKHQEYYQEKRRNQTATIRKWLQEYKKTLKCSRCEESESCCLDFHHQGKKEKLISQTNSFSCVRLLKEEIDKCEVLCANCHRKEHFKHREVV